MDEKHQKALQARLAEKMREYQQLCFFTFVENKHGADWLKFITDSVNYKSAPNVPEVSGYSDQMIKDKFGSLENYMWFREGQRDLVDNLHKYILAYRMQAVEDNMGVNNE